MGAALSVSMKNGLVMSPVGTQLYFHIEIAPVGLAVPAAQSWFDLVDASPSLIAFNNYMVFRL